MFIEKLQIELALMSINLFDKLPFSGNNKVVNFIIPDLNLLGCYTICYSNEKLKKIYSYQMWDKEI